jgi:hypothetical protein
MTLRIATATVLLVLASTVPASASSAHCTVPKSSGAVWAGLHESGIGCDAARTLALHFFAHNRLDGWRCDQQVRNRYVSFTCFRSDDHHQTLGGSWHVH